MIPDSAKSERTILYASVISLISAVTVAALTGFITFKVSRFETESHKIVSTMEARNRTLVAKLEAETKKDIEFGKQDIAKHKLFHSLITTLKDPNDGPLALLVLWRLYPKPEERKTTIVAAFEVKKEAIVKTLINLENKEEWQKSYLDTVKRLAKSEDRDIAENAKKFWSDIDDIQIGQHFLHNIIADSETHVGSDQIEDLIELVIESDAVQDLVLETSKKAKTHKALLLYILYQAGIKGPLQELINSAINSPSRFKEFENVFDIGVFDTEDSRIIAQFAINYLRDFYDSDSILDRIAFTLVTESLRNNQKLNPEDHNYIVRISKEAFMNPLENERVRYYALVTLKNISPKQALTVISQLLMNPAIKTSIPVKGEIDQVLGSSLNTLTPEIIGDSLRVECHNFTIPGAVNDNHDIWKEFHEQLVIENKGCVRERIDFNQDSIMRHSS